MKELVAVLSGEVEATDDVIEVDEPFGTGRMLAVSKYARNNPAVTRMTTIAAPNVLNPTALQSQIFHILFREKVLLNLNSAL